MQRCYGGLNRSHQRTIRPTSVIGKDSTALCWGRGKLAGCLWAFTVYTSSKDISGGPHTPKLMIKHQGQHNVAAGDVANSRGGAGAGGRGAWADQRERFSSDRTRGWGEGRQSEMSVSGKGKLAIHERGRDRMWQIISSWWRILYGWVWVELYEKWNVGVFRLGLVSFNTHWRKLENKTYCDVNAFLRRSSQHALWFY